MQRGWCAEKNKVFTRTDPLEFAREWSGKHRRRLTSDLDQALVLIGACFDGSGINASDTLKNENFKPHVALKPLLEWLQPQRSGSGHPQRGLARGVDLQGLARQPSAAARPGFACSMTMRNTSDEATAGYGVAAARHQLGMGRGSAQPDLRAPARSGACVSFCERWATGRMILPSNGGKTLVVAGLDGSLDLLTPTDAESLAGRCGQVRHPVLSGRVRRRCGAGVLAAWRSQPHPGTGVLPTR